MTRRARALRQVPSGGALYEIPPKGLIGNPQIQGKLIRGLGIRERAPAPTLSPEIVPVVLVDDYTGLDQSNIRVIRGAACAASSVGDGVTPPAICIFNPPTSGVFARIRRLYASTQGAGQMRCQISNTGVPGGFVSDPGPRFTNTEIQTNTGTLALPALQFFTGLIGLAASPIQIAGRMPAGGLLTWDEQIILVPGFQLVCASDNVTINLSVTVGAFWDEYSSSG